jgi:hypothetical protein
MPAFTFSKANFRTRYIISNTDKTIAGVNPWVVHRNTNVFGADSMSFRPDRWLKNGTGDIGMIAIFHISSFNNAC